MIKFDKAVFVATLTFHYRKNISSCGCGWSALGKSHPEHVADVYEAAMKARESNGSN